MNGSNAKQLPLSLYSSRPYSIYYLVPHSGVVDAVSLLEKAVADVIAGVFSDSGEVGLLGTFRSVYLFGPAGCGKTHLVQGYAEKAIDAGVPAANVEIVELPRNIDCQGQAGANTVSAVVGAYDRLRAAGGLLLIAGTLDPASVSANPHLQSRLLAGFVAKVGFPKENELKQLIASIAERRNLKLSDTSIGYLLKRVPVDTLSFADVFGKIDALSLERGKPATLSLVREIVVGDKSNQ